MDNCKVISFGQNGIPMSDGVTISGILVMDQTQQLFARGGRRVRDPSANYFVYGIRIKIQNNIPDYNSRDVHGEAPNRYQQRALNGHRIDDVRYSDDNRIYQDQRFDQPRNIRRDADRDFYRHPTRDDQPRYYPRDADFYRYPTRTINQDTVLEIWTSIINQLEAINQETALEMRTFADAGKISAILTVIVFTKSIELTVNTYRMGLLPAATKEPGIYIWRMCGIPQLICHAMTQKQITHTQSEMYVLTPLDVKSQMVARMMKEGDVVSKNLEG